MFQAILQMACGRDHPQRNHRVRRDGENQERSMCECEEIRRYWDGEGWLRSLSLLLADKYAVAGFPEGRAQL